jgi:hypothetical protein
VQDEPTRVTSHHQKRVAIIEAVLLTCFDPTAPDPIDIYRSAYTSNPVAKQQTNRILPESGTEKECLSRKILVRYSFEGCREYHPGNANEHEGKHESGKKRNKEQGLDVIRMISSDPRTGDTTTRARTMAAAFSPGSNGAKSGIASVAWAPDVLIAGLEVGFVN